MWNQLTRGIGKRGALAELSSASIAVAVMVGVWTVSTIAEISQSPYDASWWAYAGMAAPALLGVWLVAELLGTRTEESLSGRLMPRMVVLGPLCFTATATLGTVLLVALTLGGGIVPELSETEGPVAEVLLNAFLTWILGIAAVLGGSLIGLVFVVLPVFSWRDPAKAAQMNGEEVPAGSLAQVRVMRLSFSGMLALVFVAPALWVAGERNAEASSAGEAFHNAWLAIVDFDPFWWDRYVWDVVWVLGMLSAVLLVVSLIAVLRLRSQQEVP